jgi:hypothetical protein
MIRRRTSEAGGGVLSFTFLDVLTCTMGSLVLLLVVLAQKATDVTLEEALANANKPKPAAAENPPTEEASLEQPDQPGKTDAKTAAAVADLQKAVGDDPEGDAKLKFDEKLKEAKEGLTTEELAKQLAEVREQRQKIEKLRAETAQRRKDDEAKVSHLEEHERRLEQEIAKLQVALERLEEAEKEQSVDQEAAKAELERLKEVIAETKQQIEELRKDTVGNKSYAIVPYKGANGTMRRPIYIECTKDAVTIYPEGIRLTAADFDGPLRSGNPLNAAIRAAREELNARATAAGQTDLPDPYPLLIVRPDGAYAYGAALSAISSWDSDFGYEFVDADWKLEYPDTDPRLEQAMRHAVEQARQRQAMLAKAAPRRYGPRLALGSGEGGGMGGGDAEGDGGGFEGVAHPGGAGDRIGDHSGENWMQVSEATPENGDGHVGQPLGNGLTTSKDQTSAVFMQDAAKRENESYADAVANEPSGARGWSDTSGGTKMTDAGAEYGENGGVYTSELAQGVPRATKNGGTADPEGAQNQGPPGKKEDGPGSLTAESAGSGQPPDSSQKPMVTDGSMARTAASGSAPANEAGSGASMQVSMPTRSAASSRGTNWANQAASRKASAINRPIRVIVGIDQIDVMPTNQGDSQPLDQPTSVSFHQTTDRVLDQLAAAVQSRIREWGLAGNGMYWRPTLVLQVAPGAEQHAIRLNDLLRDSCIDVKFQEVASRTEGAGNGTTR